MSFATLKKNSKNGLQKLQSEVEKINNPKTIRRISVMMIGSETELDKSETDMRHSFSADQHNEDMASSVFSIMDFRVQAVGTSKTL